MRLAIENKTAETKEKPECFSELLVDDETIEEVDAHLTFTLLK